jgi:hypothetical protein
MPADAILRGLLNSRLPKVMRDTNDRPPRRYEDKEASALVALKAREIEQAFNDWVYTDGDRRRELVGAFNDKFNTRSLRQFDGSHLTLPGKSPDLSLRRHVMNAIWRGIQSLESDARVVARDRADWSEQQLHKAQQELPRLLPQLDQKSPNTDKRPTARGHRRARCEDAREGHDRVAQSL